MPRKKNLKNISSAMLEYYTTQGVMTNPGKYRSLYKGLPSKITTLCKVVQGVLLHILHAHRYGIELTKERKKEVQIRKIEDMLAKIRQIDNRSIVFVRGYENRLVTNCRGFSVFICSLLRHKGIPARAKCGFSTCLNAERYEDHWICEYWNSSKQRWVQVDSQLDSTIKEALNVDFDPFDVPPDKFLTGGEAWKLCRGGKADPDLFGFFDLKGLGFVRGNVIRHLMALNKLEVLPWDHNKLMSKAMNQLSKREYALLDRIAELTVVGDHSFPAIRKLYESNPALRMPADWRP